MMASPLSIQKKEAAAEAETAIYLQTFLAYRNFNRNFEIPYDKHLNLPRQPSPVEMVAGWYMIRDSDLHKHKQHGNKKKKKNRIREIFVKQRSGNNCPNVKPCDVHKAYPDGRLIGGRGPLPCGDILDWVSNSTPPSLIGWGGLLAVPFNNNNSSSSTITLFLIGGRDLAAPYGGGETKEVFFKENFVVGMKEDCKETEFNGGGGWRRGPPMNTAKHLAHPVLYDGKIFVFGGTLDSFDDGDRSPLCEVLDLRELGKENWAWEVLPNPPKDMGFIDIISAHGIFSSVDDDDVQEKILLYSTLRGDILSFNPVNKSYCLHAKAIGKFYNGATIRHEIFYGVSRHNTLHYFDVNNTRSPAERLIDLDLPQSALVIHDGLIPVGQDLLYVVGVEHIQLECRPCMLYRVYVLKYRIFRKQVNNSLKVEATLESKGSYLINHLHSIVGCLAPLAVNLALSKKGSKKGGKASKEGKKRNDTLTVCFKKCMLVGIVHCSVYAKLHVCE